MASDNKDVIFVKGSNVGTSYTTDLGTFYEYDAYINGEATTIKVDTNNQMTEDTLLYGPVYNNVGTSYTTDLGTFYEYDAYINGEATTIKVDTNNQMTEDTLLYGPVYNNKGVLTGSEDKVNAKTTTDGTLHFVTTTDSVVNDVVKLGGIPYAYEKNCNVYFISVDGELTKSDITAITEDDNDQVFFKLSDKGRLGIPYAYEKNCNVYFISVDGELTKSDITAITEDDNDQVFFKLSDKGRLTDVYVRVVDATEGVTPGAGTFSAAMGKGSNAGNLTLTVASTDNSDSTSTFTAKIYAFALASGKDTAVEVGTVGTKTLSAGTQTVAPAISGTVNTQVYYAVVTMNDGTVLTTNTIIGG